MDWNSFSSPHPQPENFRRDRCARMREKMKIDASLLRTLSDTRASDGSRQHMYVHDDAELASVQECRSPYGLCCLAYTGLHVAGRHSYRGPVNEEHNTSETPRPDPEAWYTTDWQQRQAVVCQTAKLHRQGKQAEA